MKKVRVIKIEDLDREYDVKVGDIGHVVEDIDPILVRFDRAEPLYHYLWLWQLEEVEE